MTTLLVLTAVCAVMGLFAGFSQSSFVEVLVVALLLSLCAAAAVGIVSVAFDEPGTWLLAVGAGSLGFVACFLSGAGVIAVRRARR